MRTADEKIAEIRRREEQIRRKKFRAHTIALSFVSAASAVLLVLFSAGMFMQISDHVGKIVGHYSMDTRYASVFSNDPAIGFVLTIIFAFALGVCVTLLSVKIRRHSEREKRQ